jgi:hypothetical protein
MPPLPPNYEEEITFQLEPVIDQKTSGQLRTELEKLLQQRELSNFVITVRRITEAHGLYTPTSKTPASLLVLRFKVTSKDKSQKRRMKSLKITLKFEKEPLGDPFHDPVISTFAPCQDGAVYLSNTDQEETTSVSQGVDATLRPPPPVPLEVAAHWNKNVTKQATRNYIAKVMGEAEKSPEGGRGGGRQGADVVWWNMWENPVQKDGISDTFAVAVLVKRDDLVSKFNVRLELEPEVDVKHSWHKIWEKQQGPIGFDPESEAVGFPKKKKGEEGEEYKLDDLGRFARESLMDGLAWMHLPEKLETVSFHGKKKD